MAQKPTARQTFETELAALDLHNQKQAASNKAARSRIEREINVTDEQIDALVYELYGLTDEEIKIVEGA